MPRILVWDLPVRVFHWTLALLFIAALAIATTASDESSIFTLHAAAGLVILFAIALRIVWGVVGARHARFANLDLRASSLIAYLRGAAGLGPATRHVAHNPATAWFAIASFLVIAGLGFTGLRLGRGDERFEEIHEVLAWTMAGLAAIHIAGVIWHRLRTKECLALSMVTGTKEGEPQDGLTSRHALAGGLFALLLLGWGGAVYSGWDPAKRSLTVPGLGIPLQIGEAEEERGATGERKAADDEEHEEHEDD